MPGTKSLISLLCLIAANPLHAADAKDAPASKIFAVARHGPLELPIPKGWKDTLTQPPRPGIPPTIELTTDGKKFLVMITPLPSRGGEADFNSAEKVRAIAEAQGRRMLPTAKETALVLEAFKGEKAVGSYWTFTDKAPDPGSFECATTAFVGVGDLLLSVTILHHDKGSPERQLALDMLKGASQRPAVVLAELRMAAPGGAWELVIPVNGFEVTDEKENQPRKIKQLMAENAGTGLIASIFIEPARKEGDSSAVRDAYWGRARQSPIPKENIKLDKAGDYATVDYIVPGMAGEALRQKNVNIYIAHEGMWIDVHLSKVQFEEKDQAIFDEVVKGIRFEKVKK